MREGREFEETEHYESDRLFSLDEILSEFEVEGVDIDDPTMSEDERTELLQDIHSELLTKDECDELVRGSICEISPIRVGNETRSYPEVAGVRIDSFNKLEGIVDQKFPGLMQSRTFNKWMRYAKQYYSKVPHPSTPHPTIFRMIDHVLRNQNRVRALRERLGAFQNADVVRKKLRELEMEKSIDSWPTNDIQWKNLDIYYQVLNLLEKGMLQCDIDRKLKLSSARTKTLVNGVLPWPVRIVVEPDSERSRIQTKRVSINFSESSYSIRKINTIVKEFPGLATHIGFPSLISDAKSHQALTKQLKNRQKIRISELVEISDRLGISHGKARQWTLEAKKPQLSIYIERAIQNKMKAKELRNSLFVNSMDHLTDLRENLYIDPHLKEWENSEVMEYYAKTYFQLLDLLETGFPLSNIAKLLSVNESSVLSWLNGKIPRALLILKEIPHKEPRQGWKWLPTNVEDAVYSSFIEVPIVDIESSSVMDVCSQLGVDFDDFMYVLGVTLSDGYIQPTSKSSYSLRILLSQKYDWSVQILKDVSEILSVLKPSEILYMDREDDAVCELVIDSPFFIWLREVIFNLDPNDRKTYASMESEWIIDSSDNSRIAFLQGVADGDGYASLTGQRVGIGTLANRHFFKKLLDSIDISSSLQLKGVDIFKHDSIRKLSTLPLFKNAQGRLENLFELRDMINARPDRKPASSEEVSTIVKLKKKGLTNGEIVLHLWRNHKTSRSLSTIGRIVRQSKLDSQ